MVPVTIQPSPDRQAWSGRRTETQKRRRLWRDAEMDMRRECGTCPFIGVLPSMPE
jgi:hypothetical protein